MNAPQAEPAVEAVTPPPAPAEALPSPGALLRRARERAGLGADDLAGQLKLAKGTLEALERDDFAALSEPVYIRGYYRKIAKVLPIAEAELINAYNARAKPAAPAAQRLQRLPLAGGVAAGASRQTRGPGVALLVGALILVVVLVAMLTREPPKRIAAVTTEAPVPPPPAAPAAGPDTTAVTATPDATDTNGTTATTNDAVAEPRAAEPAPAEPGTDAPATGAPAATAAPAPAVTPAAIPVVPNQLVLDFTEPSFVRVEDAQGRTLKIGLVRGGERHALDGAPPYTVFLGTSQNVKVYFGGAPVDFSAHVNAETRTARFTVP